ncbi:hypothetical protein [Flavobacterium sp. N1994]|uniref:hypothetical protein n=1 Tax=Flavobacterium sp. N1994 TaxID=2986827 RepID=UPI002221E807|nr:hypothetical protein [Flavobacterium sp. N1994]
MRTFLTTLVFFIAVNSFGQNLDELGMDNNPNLTEAESKFLTDYMSKEQRQNFNFKDKKVIFVTGNSGQQLGTKSKYFDYIREWNKNGNKIATWVVELNEKEKIYSGGYDVIVTYWVKMFTENRKKKILKLVKANN